MEYPSVNEYLEAVRTFTVNGVAFKMVLVEGGTFRMGAADDDGGAFDDEKPAYDVTLDSYYLAEVAVTQALWLAVMGDNPSDFKGDLQRPVEKVSWHDCQTFLERLNQQTGQRFCLPTEAQWEYAARGGVQSKGFRYAGSHDLNEVAWFLDNSGWTTHPVAQKRPNELGLYDMSGNVLEWCQNWFEDYTDAPQHNPQGPATGVFRVLRGGSWSNLARCCRLSFRFNGYPGYCSRFSGLRLALPVDNA